MTCNNCEHYEVCNNHTMNLCNSCYWNVDVVKPKNGTCRFFKDKRKIIGLPFSVGDEVYAILDDCEEPPFIVVGRVFALGIDENLTMWISVRYDGGLKMYYTPEKIGKTIFLTKEAAEIGLSEYEQKHNST